MISSRMWSNEFAVRDEQLDAIEEIKAELRKSRTVQHGWNAYSLACDIKLVVGIHDEPFHSHLPVVGFPKWIKQV